MLRFWRKNTDEDCDYVEMSQDRQNNENILIKKKTGITQAFNTSIRWQILGEGVTMVKGR